MTPWLVSTPEYGEVVPILDDGTGPMEYGCDYVFIEADTRKDALYLGVMLMRRKGAKWFRDAENPYAGIKVESQVCPAHGKAVWCDDHFECPDCEALFGLSDGD